MCIFKMILGAGFIISGILVEITWLGVCFGTVILGIILLFVAPEILFAPFTIGLASGLVFFANCEE